MRQAGRYLPEYRRIREEHDNFLDLCFKPDVASEISLQPIRRFNFDFIILFADILVIPHALGQKVAFLKNHGPILEPIKSIKNLNYQNLKKCLDRISNIFQTLSILNGKKKDKKLIGFCGGPFTVLNYMVEGGTSRTHQQIKVFVKERRKEALELIHALTDISIEYLKQQIDAGADFVQIFESWAGLLKGKEYQDFIINPNQIISNELKRYKKSTKIIHFPRGSGYNYIEFIKEVVCDVISIDLTTPDEIKKLALEKNIIIQGDLDPKDLVAGGDQLEKEIKKTLDKFKDNSHIFNLSHGILPNTPIENVEKTIKIINSYDFTRRTS